MAALSSKVSAPYGASQGPSLGLRKNPVPLRNRLSRVQPVHAAQPTSLATGVTTPALVASKVTTNETLGMKTEPAGQTSTTTASAPEPSSYVWERNWAPVAPLASLDPSRPNPVMLLGQSLVVWRHAELSRWVVQCDVCPHRLAPLSEGRLDAAGNRLTCAYHGWEFNEEGQCTRVPQLMADPRAAATAYASARNCVKTFPTLEHDGLLFVWLDDSVEGRAAAQLARKPRLHDDNAPTTIDWLMNELPSDYKFWLEQAMDPSHASFLHQGLVNFSSTTAVPMAGKPVENVDLMKGFRWQHGAYEKSLTGLQAIREFQPPFTVAVWYNQANGTLTRYWTLVVPVRPGVARVFFRAGFGKPAPEGTADDGAEPNVEGSAITASTLPSNRQDSAADPPGPQRDPNRSGRMSGVSGRLASAVARLFNWLPHWVYVGQLLADQDLTMMCRQEVLMDRNGLTYRDYALNSMADAGVAATNMWFKQAGYPHGLWGESRGPQSGATYGNWPALDLSLDDLLSRQDRHVRHCVTCQKGMKFVTAMCAALTAAAGLAAVVAATLAVIMVVNPNAAAAVGGWGSFGGAVTAALGLGAAAVQGWAFREERFVSGASQWRRIGGFAYMGKKTK
ncbi:hypothetical protein Vafri_1022 [Volvox africanus]|nr:hypothetical protein Vafri_1022 [Volvox africanus]